MKIRRSELFRLLSGIESVKELRGIKLGYAAARNKKRLLEELESLQESIKPRDDFVGYDQKRLELCKQFCEHDERGGPILNNGVFAGLEGNDAFQAKLKTLRKKHEKVIADRQKDVDEYNRLLSEETEIEIHKVQLADLPEGITGKQIDLLLSMIEDDKGGANSEAAKKPKLEVVGEK